MKKKKKLKLLLQLHKLMKLIESWKVQFEIRTSSNALIIGKAK